jgi:hypothetical protein
MNTGQSKGKHGYIKYLATSCQSFSPYSILYLLTPWCYSSCRTLATSHILCGFVTANFYRVGLSAPRPTPNLEDQNLSLSLAPPSKPVRHEWPHQQLCCHRHSFRVHWCTEAPSPSKEVLSTK